MSERTEIHPSVSALGSHLDEEIGGKQSSNFWTRVERQLHTMTSSKHFEAPPSKEDEKVEEAMHLGQ
jgi:hypothetical protein